MMPPPDPPGGPPRRSLRRPPDDPEEWLNRARSNLAQARLGRQPEVYLEDLCFQAQQAAEKALKALLLRLRGEGPFQGAGAATALPTDPRQGPLRRVLVATQGSGPEFPSPRRDTDRPPTNLRHRGGTGCEVPHSYRPVSGTPAVRRRRSGLARRGGTMRCPD